MDELGQAADGPETVAGLAQFLVDNSPEPDDENDEQLASDEPEEGTSDDATDAPADGEDDESEAAEADAEQQASGQKFKVVIKGDDGVERTEEVDETERAAGYLRHGDYTKKTMELADREREAYQVVTSKIGEFQQHYAQQAQQLQTALHQMAGLRTAEEMAVLAQTDPAAWVQENQRAQSVRGFLSRVEQSMQQERTQAQQLEQEQLTASQRRMGEELMREGFDVPKFQTVLQGVNKSYGYTGDELKRINDPRLVRMMRDAVAYRELQAKAPEVTKKVTAAPKIPPARRPAPQSEKANKALDQRFRSGKAGTKDLAAFLQQHERAKRR